MSETLKLGMTFNDGKEDYYVYSLARKNDGTINMQLRAVTGDAVPATATPPRRHPQSVWERPVGTTAYVPSEHDHDEI